MNYWKLGTKWGNKAPDFYDILLKYSIVICGRSQHQMNKGDFVLITKGYEGYALARIKVERYPVTNRIDLEGIFDEYDIEYHSGIYIADADIWEFKEEERFSYRLQQGIRQIHKPDIIKKMNIYYKGIMGKKILEDCKSLLEANKNLVLTGAPGTGKTYLAHRIAEAMGAETRFVQFHPSYDYTDFVEGLRPVDTDGTIGFERKDGAFKAFCKEAIRNIQDSEKSIDQLSEERSWQERLSDFVDEAIEKKKKFKTVNGSEFVIKEQREHSLVVYNEQNEKTSDIYLNTDEVLMLLTNNVELSIVRNIKEYFRRKFATQQDSYIFAIIKAIRAEKRQVAVEKVSKVERKNFVFIIDEINRGEASKIFGELFYAIDPGYRVVAGDEDDVKSKRVDTQYQNLVPESDVFSKGFYVPDNVYILATMNDIDRSVESMDFAMRRRFTWKEVRPSDTATMLDGLDCAEDAKETMTRLNEVIAKTEELGAAYMIGPAYFLKLKDNNGDFNSLWQLNIEPLLKEYLRGFRKADELLEKFRMAYFNEAYGTGNEA